MSLIQLWKFKKWEIRLFKMPHLETPCFLMGTRVTVASGHCRRLVDNTSCLNMCIFPTDSVIGAKMVSSFEKKSFTLSTNVNLTVFSVARRML